MRQKGSKSETLITLAERQLPVVSIFSIHASPRSWNLWARSSARQQRPQKAVPQLSDPQPTQLEKQPVAGPFTLLKESGVWCCSSPGWRHVSRLRSHRRVLRELMLLHLPLSYPNRLYQLRFHATRSESDA